MVSAKIPGDSWFSRTLDTAGEVALAVDEGGKGTENSPDLGCFEAPPDFASSITLDDAERLISSLSGGR